MAYKLTDRLKEWTTYVGILMAMLGVAIPDFIPAAQWTQYLADAQMIIGVVLTLLPQTAGTTHVENDALALLRALTQKLPPAYAPALGPTIATLARVLLQPDVPPATNSSNPGPVAAAPIPQIQARPSRPTPFARASS